MITRFSEMIFNSYSNRINLWFINNVCYIVNQTDLYRTDANRPINFIPQERQQFIHKKNCIFNDCLLDHPNEFSEILYF